MTPQLQAAHALLDHCRNQPDEPVFPEGKTAHDTPLLIEGEYDDGTLAVTMPDGQVWRYTLAMEGKGLFRRALLVCIHHRDPHSAACFRPTGEGIHPFVGIAHRFGVERGDAK